MHQPSSKNKRRAVAIAALAMIVIAVAYLFRPLPGSPALTRLRSILLSAATPQRQLQELAPYVTIGDQISAVDERISPSTDQVMQVERPTEHTYGLRDVNLVLAIRADGTVIGIGREKHGIDDGTVWLSPPKW